IVDTARAIVDGHIILSRGLAEQGVFPAIDVGKSLSRVMADIVTPEHHRAAANLRRLWSVYEENRDLILMGAYREGSDPGIDEAIARHADIHHFIRQGQQERAEYDGSVAALTASFGA
ncbi:MAG TPA: flagellum-specific ATP synthase FliI, partial [Sphingomonadaceae bacterium]|nr:flagellum-specific ATP synthase FliI [Sphingomonadaceae bacterium]